MQAFAADTSYAISMAKHASTIQSKRDVWALRLQLREAERSARERCVDEGVTWCSIESPCGTGQCPFAPAELAALDVRGAEGATPRPARSDYPTYSIEAARLPLQALNGEAPEPAWLEGIVRISEPLRSVVVNGRLWGAERQAKLRELFQGRTWVILKRIHLKRDEVFITPLGDRGRHGYALEDTANGRRIVVGETVLRQAAALGAVELPEIVTEELLAAL